MATVITNLEGAVCPASATLRQAVARINDSIYLFQVVVADDGRALGVLTDGDVRRALLRDVALDANVSAAMNATPKLGRYGAHEENARAVARLDERVGFLPVVDERGILRQILLAEKRGDRITTALIMAGGRGSRLGERTRETPKPLIPVGGRPMLDRIMESVEAAGVQRIIVTVHYLADRIEAFIAERNNRARVELLHEDMPLGTAGALGALPADIQGDLLVINGDVMTQADYQAFFSFHQHHGNDATLAATQQTFNIPFGVVQSDADGKFRSIEEKPSLRYFVNSGFYILSPTVYRLVGPREHCDMPALLNRAHGLGYNIGVFPVHEYWKDVGRPDDLEAAHRDIEAHAGETGK